MAQLFSDGYSEWPDVRSLLRTDRSLRKDPLMGERLDIFPRNSFHDLGGLLGSLQGSRMDHSPGKIHPISNAFREVAN